MINFIYLIETNFINENNYDCIIIPSSHDSHFEHRFVSGFGSALIRTSHISLIEYNLPSTLQAWIPNLFIEISDVYETKIQMLKQFKSQQNKPYFQRDTIDGFHTDFDCSKKGMNKND